MTRDEILALGAGRELDALVCDAVGIKPTPRYLISNDGGASFTTLCESRDEAECFLTEMPLLREAGYAIVGLAYYPRVSTDIAAAWQVVERLLDEQELELTLQPTHLVNSPVRDGWYARFADKYNTFSAGFSAAAETSPLAICRAVLLAVAASEQVEVVR